MTDRNLAVAGAFDAEGWLINASAGVIHQLSPNYDARPPETAIELLVIHHISLPPAQFGGTEITDFFCNRLNCDAHPYFAQLRDVHVSAHFLIDRNGQITQFVPCSARAWHAGQSSFQGRIACNNFSIGIELEGTGELPYTDAQYAQLAMLTRLLSQHYPLQAVVGHSDIAPSRKTDPGPSFDWQHYYQLSGLSEQLFAFANRDAT